MMSQPRFRQQVPLSPAITELATDTGWAAHYEHLIMLMASVLESRPALCRTFWSEPDFLADGSLSSMLLNARYPLNAELLPTLLAALCADPDSAARAWGFAHSVQRVCYRCSRQADVKAALADVAEHLRIEVRCLHPPALCLD